MVTIMSSYNPPYTQKEEQAVLNFIIENDAIERVKGDAIWRKMEEAEVTKRSWQSLKQHFRCSLIHKINEKCYGLGIEAQQHFYKVMSRVAVRTNTSRRTSKLSDERDPAWFVSSSSDSDDDDTMNWVLNKTHSEKKGWVNVAQKFNFEGDHRMKQ